jgi:hypothetical protein
MKTLHLLYDAQNEFALRCRCWLTSQPAVVRLEFIPFQAPELMAKFPGIDPYREKNSVLAVTDEGAVYAGPQAYVVCLFVLDEYRQWAERLSDPTLLPFAAGAINFFASLGGKIPRWVEELNDAELIDLLYYQSAPRA